MASNYTVIVNLSADTVAKAKALGFKLYGFKSVKASSNATQPVVWFKDTDYLQTNRIDWSEQYQAFTSLTDPIGGGAISALTSANADLGQEADVDQYGNITVKNSTPGLVTDNSAQAVTIINTSDLPFTAGLASVQNGVSKAMCAMPLYGNTSNFVAPIEKITLMFASDNVNTGSVVSRTYSQALQIDLTASNTRTVAFDINTSWSWGNEAWGTLIPRGENLQPFIITPF
ncbi:MAG: hypothetical protein RJA87_1615 [Pseudomonadota bacterium]|jgi:hypothetical protein